MEKDTKEILEIVTFMRDRMATKEDLAELEGRMNTRMDGIEDRMATKEDLSELESRMATKDDIRAVRADIKGLDDRLVIVEEKVDNLAGVTKEVDYVLSEISAIKAFVKMP